MADRPRNREHPRFNAGHVNEVSDQSTHARTGSLHGARMRHHALDMVVLGNFHLDQRRHAQALRGTQARGRMPRWVRAAAAAAVIASAAFVGWRMWQRTPSVTILTAAAAYYDGGIMALQEGAYLLATRSLECAVEIDPSFTLTWARLAEAQLEPDPAARCGECANPRTHPAMPARSASEA